ncbi:hypothetical protein AIG44_24710 [Salmonella enterica subsp. enterica serovar Bredeney]|nr:hypothetical protein [Salmonella enterica subsp. enterica serovar Bredeney]
MMEIDDFLKMCNPNNIVSDNGMVRLEINNASLVINNMTGGLYFTYSMKCEDEKNIAIQLELSPLKMDGFILRFFKVNDSINVMFLVPEDFYTLMSVHYKIVETLNKCC